jgi:hypothetical protein
MRKIFGSFIIDFSPLIFYGPSSFPISSIQGNRNTKSTYKKDNGKNIDKRAADISTGKCFEQKLEIRGRRIVYAQFHPYPPVPIRTGAISESIPDTEKKPGKESQTQKNQVSQSRFLPDPTKDIEQHDKGMENEKEHIQKGIHFPFLYQQYAHRCNMPPNLTIQVSRTRFDRSPR